VAMLLTLGLGFVVVWRAQGRGGAGVRG
jgi:hypothetical protein